MDENFQALLKELKLSIEEFNTIIDVLRTPKIKGPSYMKLPS